jgi:hypothetical protein
MRDSGGAYTFGGKRGAWLGLLAQEGGRLALWVIVMVMFFITRLHGLEDHATCVMFYLCFPSRWLRYV